MESLLSKILVIDDDLVDRKVLKRCFRNTGMNLDIVEAEDSEEGLRLLCSGEFHCAYVDYLLPGKTGLEIIQEAHERGVAIPCVLMTGHGDEMMVVNALQSGAVDYLPKGELSDELVYRSLRYVEQFVALEAMQRESEERFRKIVANLPIAVACSRKNQEIVYLNKQFIDNFGYRTDNIPCLRDWFKQVFPEAEERAAIADLWFQQSAAPGDSPERYLRSVECTFLCLDRTVKQIEVSIAWEGEHAYITFNDITQRKLVEKQLAASERELRQVNEKLEKKVLARTGELQALNERMQDKNEELSNKNSELQTVNEELQRVNKELQTTQAVLARSEKMIAVARLVTGVAHEINTPIGVCVTVASHLADRTRTVDSLCQQGLIRRGDLQDFLNETEESATLVLENLQQAASLISRFKQVSVDQNSEKPQAFLLNDCIKSAFYLLDDEIQSAGHEVQITGGEGVWIKTYLSPLEEIFRNLLRNVLDHAFSPGQPGLISVSLQTDKNQLHIRFADNGKGMEEETLDKVFDPFFTTARKRRGAGLGLSVVYNLVTQLFDGSIEFWSRPGRGTSVYLTLPVEYVERP
ncbi:MAG TPA: ATP-binding protein [Patescibacteria group bacterium]|nr:ATP-binding protein [Patescibacteria group bacterium]